MLNDSSGVLNAYEGDPFEGANINEAPLHAMTFTHPQSFVDQVFKPAGSNWGLVENANAGARARELRGNIDKHMWRMQSNRIARREFASYEVVWTAKQSVTRDEEMRRVEACGAWSGEGFVAALRPGDRAGLWLRAMYPGWENHVKWASVEIVYEAR